MFRLKKMLPYMAFTVAAYLGLPLIQRGYGLFLTPIPVFICAFIYGFRNRFHWSYLTYVSIAAVLFLPIIFIYFNETAFAFLPILVIAVVAGILTGRVFAMPVP